MWLPATVLARLLLRLRNGSVYRIWHLRTLPYHICVSLGGVHFLLGKQENRGPGRVGRVLSEITRGPEVKIRIRDIPAPNTLSMFLEHVVMMCMCLDHPPLPKTRHSGENRRALLLRGTLDLSSEL